mgnify:CR=1 FL=1
MSVLVVCGWDRFQHYKDRDPPWIKLYRSLLQDYLFITLSDRDKCHLILLWLWAACTDNCLPRDAAWLRRRLGLHSDPNLELFINQGWLLVDASINSEHVASTEKRREEKRREETSTPVDKSQKPIAEHLQRRAGFLYKKPNEP